MAGWHSRHGSWWAAHWCWSQGFTILPGVHVDWHRRVTAREGIRFGPYVDVHFAFGVVSVGVNPIWSTELAINYRQGRRADGLGAGLEADG
jgi:hypothetical protein